VAKQDERNPVIREDGSAVAEALPEFARPDNDTLRSIVTVEDMQAFLASRGMEFVDGSAELGTGWVRADDDEAAKRELVDKPLAIFWWTIQPGDFHRVDPNTGEAVRTNFVSMFVRTEAGERLIITDGSTGIARELEAYTKRTGRTGGLVLPRGFRESPYRIDATTKRPVPRDYDGPTEPASTFYLAV
jgi:hypothetical protein